MPRGVLRRGGLNVSDVAVCRIIILLLILASGCGQKDPGETETQEQDSVSADTMRILDVRESLAATGSRHVVETSKTVVRAALGLGGTGESCKGRDSTSYNLEVPFEIHVSRITFHNPERSANMPAKTNNGLSIRSFFEPVYITTNLREMSRRK